MLIKDIPPVSKHKSLEINRPEVYYGELEDEFVIANSKEKEFNYPKGEKNIYTSYNGDTDFYIFEEEDPVVSVYKEIFPGLFKNKEEMSGEIRKHVRYPSGMLLAQGLVYAKYHMTDPTVFYNQEDLWVRATGKYYNNVQPLIKIAVFATKTRSNMKAHSYRR